METLNDAARWSASSPVEADSRRQEQDLALKFVFDREAARGNALISIPRAGCRFGHRRVPKERR